MQDEIKKWIKKISENDMPMLANTVQEVMRLTGSENVHVASLAEVIARDSNMTARVLRVVNSVFYSSVVRQPLTTISRAVAVLGLKELRAICTFGATLSHFGKGKPHEGLLKEMALAVQTAALAKHIARSCGERDLEEVFISALLYNFGDMCFFHLGGDLIKQYEELQLAEPELSKADLERKLLGFPLYELTAEIGKLWRLGDLLQQALSSEEKSATADLAKNELPIRPKIIVMSRQFALAARCGWNCLEALQMREYLCKELAIKSNTLEEILLLSAEESMEIARLYGAQDAVLMIAVPPQLLEKTQPTGKTKHEHINKNEITIVDGILESQILSILARKIRQNSELTELLPILLEGIHRAAGLDRVLYAELTPDHTMLLGKSSVGLQHVTLRDSCSIDLNREHVGLYNTLLKEQEFIWHKVIPRLQENTAEHTKEYFIKGSCFLGPIIANKAEPKAEAKAEDKTVDSTAEKTEPKTETKFVCGIIYADRRPSDRQLERTSFECFQRLVRRVNQTEE